ncbi:polysaccharide deacetylase family protein [Petroclostridium sp. X23]|uniref:polysaccharide deacetylase family protein n=1 Tax=Petroclostridium sp. X23 TaxID=3045146 RepID=UPI0024AD2CF7|nr:polysaccharide deacetylase family protein [Petroclostridium sp. X23]WHH58371.1 polysaccharide deacetylase family protein [Petroclostridium sp. X23]
MFKLSKFLFGIILIAVLVFNFAAADTTLTDGSIADTVEHDAKVPILLYHNIMDDFDPKQSSVHISPKLFEEHMLSLKNAGFHTIDFNQYYDYRINGQPLPEKPVIITFDDGYSSNYEQAFPTLKRLDMKATIFILTGRMGAADDVTYPHFTWKQAREMQESGVIDIQSHSDLHPNMMQQSVGRVQLELRRSKYLIEKNLNKTCDVFAYPYGLYNNQAQEMAEKAGYKMQVFVGDKGVNEDDTSLRQLKRLTAFGNINGEQLIEMIKQNTEGH